jgi:hypothetical protein
MKINYIILQTPHVYMIWCFGELIVFLTSKFSKSKRSCLCIVYFKVKLENFTKIPHLFPRLSKCVANFNMTHVFPEIYPISTNISVLLLS